jgi:diguanylate cyclase (GGDEF)-like protein
MSEERKPIVELTEQVFELEGRADALALRLQRLERLREMFLAISNAADEAAIAAATLRGAWLALGYGRAMWFTVAGGAAPDARWEIDGGYVQESNYGDSFPENSALVRIAAGLSDAAAGAGGEIDDPLFDVRGWYAIALIEVDDPSAILYADAHAERTLSEWAISALQDLAKQAALALRNVRLTERLERLATRDPLTGLLNRRALFERLDIEMRNTRRTGASLAFAMLDVDNFKSINDSRGHAGGDAALRDLATVLSAATRETDIPARFAGDEFALVMPRTDTESARIVLERLYDGLRGVGLGCSTGVAFAPAEVIDQKELLERADARAYIAKRAGKGRFILSG